MRRPRRPGRPRGPEVISERESNLISNSIVSGDRAERYRSEGWWDGRRLADGIESAALRRPDALAVADEARRLTRAQLATAVAAGAALLDGLSDPGRGVVLVTGNTVEGVVAYHSILRSGLTVLVLDRRCGPADMAHALDLLPRALVVAPRHERARLVGRRDEGVLALESFGDGTPADGRSIPEPDRDAPALILFTSGTTGRPKGVVHSLNTLTAGAANMARITSADHESVLYLVSPLTSIAGIMQMHLAADCHAALVLDDRFEPHHSLDRLNREGATILGGAPVIAERLLRSAQATGEDRIALRTLALGGAMLPRPLLEWATDRFGIEIARVYGSSEAPNFTGSLPDDDRERRLSDDGALMPGSEVRVGSVDHPQEGLLRGPGVFLGYANPEDDAAAVPEGWFRSGDLVEMSGGRLTVVGRLKDVVNRNGLKISLDEIDAALAGLAGASECAAFGVSDPTTGERLVVAVVAEPGVAIALEDVIAHLLRGGTARRKLPEELVVWDGPLPRTASGKVVRPKVASEASTKRSGRARTDP